MILEIKCILETFLCWQPCFVSVWCPEGNLLAVHRKIHLFDIGNLILATFFILLHLCNIHFGAIQCNDKYSASYGYSQGIETLCAQSSWSNELAYIQANCLPQPAAAI